MTPEELKKTEEKIGRFWKEDKVFEKSLELRTKAKPFVFFEGPPTANGMPHIGHLINICFKDIYGRYKTMRGFYVSRRAGWDTHGLPVEIEVEKQLGFKSKKDIEDYGIAKFNRRCKESVWKYKAEWEKLEERIGYWIDQDNPYITYDSGYIETLWWIIKKIFDKKLLYKGHKVVPYCSRCESTLSSHEVAQGYADVTETSVFINFKIVNNREFEGSYLLAWTTTPWTLPGNVALAVGEKIKYAEVKLGGKKYILAEELKHILGEEVKVVRIINGRDLIGLEYEPLFKIPALKTKTSYRVYPANFVTTQEGTGIVHTAVMYGEEDYELGKVVGLPMHHTVDEHGQFTAEVPGFAGQYVKEADKEIVHYLKTNGSLFKEQPHTHTYPFCWRCNTPLLYYAKDSWFIQMSSLRKKLVENNNEINWVPQHIREGRFGEFLKEAKDWALSRERYWATPLPIWKCENCSEIMAVGSYEELEKNRFRNPNTYFFLRHGASTKTVSKNKILIASQLESDHYDLTPKGVEQITKVARELKKKNKINMILASPFIRTKRTAQIISEYLGIKVRIDRRLKEVDHGKECEGLFEPVCGHNTCKTRFDVKLGSGENQQDVKNRLTSLLKELEKKYEGKNILIVTHADLVWLATSMAANLSEKEAVAVRKTNLPKEGELKKVSFKNLPYNDEGNLDPHRPFVDEITLKCKKCGEKMKRTPELIDVWFDSGAMPLAQWHYPFQNKKLIDSGHQYPADFISEAIDQTRGWFYTLLAEATVLGRKPPYKNVITHGHILDASGKKMSKSKGNVIRPDDAINKVGADATRWFFYSNTTPGNPTPLAMKDLENKYFGFISTLLNTLRFFKLYSAPDKTTENPEPQILLDKWLDMRLDELIAGVTQSMDEYDPSSAARVIEDFVINDLSNWWVRRSRRRFQKPQSEAEAIYVSSFLRSILLTISKLLAPFTPFLSEHLYLELKKNKKGEEISVHLLSWPTSKKVLDDKQNLIVEMSKIRELANSGLAIRKAKQIKVRQPLASATLKFDGKFNLEIERLLAEELNVKKINYDPKQSEAIILEEKITDLLRQEGLAREITRQIQDMRKEAKYEVDDKIVAHWGSDSPDIQRAMERFEKEISSDALLARIFKGKPSKFTFDLEKDVAFSPNEKIWLAVKK
jgi:isoleucyl-tRNA synthetase